MSTLLSEVDDPLLRGAVTFVYSSLMVNPEVEGFFEQHLALFESAGEEHKLEYHRVYRAFEALMERLLSDHAEGEGYESAPAFVEAVRRAAEMNSRAQKMLQLLLAATTYEKFFAMMKMRVKQAEQRWRSEAKQVDAMVDGGGGGGGGRGGRAEAKHNEEEKAVDCSEVFKAQQSDSNSDDETYPTLKT